MTKKAKPKPIRTSVTKADIHKGHCGNMYSCAVALALARATKDECATVYERDYIMHARIHGRHIPLPLEVGQFVRDFDDLPRSGDDTPSLSPTAIAKLGVKPFSFELPSLDSPEWKEECYHCEELFEPSELDDEGYCPECHETQS